MNEPSPNESGSRPPANDRHQPNKPGAWPDDYWFSPRRRKERGSDPHDAAGERGRTGRRHGEHRGADLDQTVVDLQEKRPDLDQTVIDIRDDDTGPIDLQEIRTALDPLEDPSPTRFDLADPVRTRHLPDDRTAALESREVQPDLDQMRLDLQELETPMDLREREKGDPQEGKASRNPAVITGSVFFIIDTIVMADAFARPVGTGSRILVIFIWLIGVAAIALLWLRASSKKLAFSIRSPISRAEPGAQAGSGDPKLTP